MTMHSETTFTHFSSDPLMTLLFPQKYGLIYVSSNFYFFFAGYNTVHGSCGLKRVLLSFPTLSSEPKWLTRVDAEYWNNNKTCGLGLGRYNQVCVEQSLMFKQRHLVLGDEGTLCLRCVITLGCVEVPAAACRAAREWHHIPRRLRVTNPEISLI